MSQHISHNKSTATTDHHAIRSWVEERGGHPACVKQTGGRNEGGLLRIDFPGYSGAATLQEISWTEFFKTFDAQKLAFLYQDVTLGGQKSNFNKLISREGIERSSGAGPDDEDDLEEVAEDDNEDLDDDDLDDEEDEDEEFDDDEDEEVEEEDALEDEEGELMDEDDPLETEDEDDEEGRQALISPIQRRRTNHGR